MHFGTELDAPAVSVTKVSMQMKRNDVRNIGDASDKEASVGDRVNYVSVPDVKRLIAFRNVTFVPTTILQTGWGGRRGKW